ncbi:MAG: hypothetical protein H7A31_04775 [Thermotogae bacterium]|nr:hypothetical protein [Thermotogota bacterium]MCP5465991.1 hypothetical protein [Thermotogota bacterium]HOO74201.1 hypothetical protein [Tepiditoga sp.]
MKYFFEDVYGNAIEKDLYINSEAEKKLSDKGVLKEDILVKWIYSNEKRLNDVCRYFIIDGNIVPCDGKDFILSKYSDVKIEGKYKSVVLILESPHKDEYTGYSMQENSFCPIAPANGKTGFAIEKYKNSSKNAEYYSLRELIMNFTDIKKEKYAVILCNPVQYQTSLGSFTGKFYRDLRDDMWKSMYPYFEKDFIKRIKSYNPELIINACTGKNKEGELKKYVSESLIKEKYRHIMTPHPFSWIFGGIKKSSVDLTYYD